MPKIRKTLPVSIPGLLLILVSCNTTAALLNLPQLNPDLFSPEAQTSLNFSLATTCYLDGATSGETGTCGDKSKGKAYDNPINGILTISNSNGSGMQLNNGSGNEAVNGTTYTLIANFDVNGAFVDGSLSALGTVPANNDFGSGTLVSSTSIVDFGYNGFNSAGGFEFEINNISGDFAAFGSGMGVLASGTNFNQISSYGSWNDNVFRTDFSGSVNVDTFISNANVAEVPLPAGFVLLGSALLGLCGIRRRSN